jgi:serine/threonine-protein kinase
MAVSPGTRLGSYEVVAPLGAGGMGEVYRARDLNLGRDVAIKLLPEDVTADVDWRRRFEREARLLASITHPNIAIVHGFETAGHVPFLVMELVPGQTLAERLSEGRLALDEALDVLRQIAAALEVAHDAAIVHRDLKPANIKITPEGTVKVLDFGIAKIVKGTGVIDSGSQTVSSAETQRGVVVGTAPYMSPEQARGKAVDRRSDIWSFGCVAFELLSWQPAFRGETATDTIAVILRGEPDWNALPADLPRKVCDLLRRCLQKDPAKRPRDARDLRLAIEELQADPAVPEMESRAAAPRAKGGVLAWALAGAALGAAVTLAIWRIGFASSPAPARPVVRFPFEVGTGTLHVTQGPAMAMSPDGTAVVYAATNQGATQLYLRRLHDLEGIALAGTAGGNTPFFSPDGNWIAFAAEGKLKKVPTGGGQAVTLADAVLGRGGDWAPDDSIVFGADSFLHRVSASGGAAQRMPDKSSEKPTRATWPSVLPGGKAVLYTAWTEQGESSIAVRLLDTGESRVLVPGGTYPKYVVSGHLLFARFVGSSNQPSPVGELWAAPFDVDRLAVTGDAALIVDNLRVNAGGAAHYSVSRDGTLVYVPATIRSDSTLVWVNRSGMSEPLTSVKRAYQMPRVSPDGRRVAVGISERNNTDVWVLDLDRNTSSRLTFDASVETSPIWSPDGQWVVYSSSKDTTGVLVRRRADANGAEERLTSASSNQTPQSWSPDGRLIVYSERNLNNIDLWLLPIAAGPGKPEPFLVRPFQDRGGVFSPDGKFVAYLTNETGRNEVIVRQFPDTGKTWQVSNTAGTEPAWSRDGKQLFYRSDSRLMAVTIATSPAFKAGPPLPLFDARFNSDANISPGHATYDVGPDGRFVFVQSDAPSGSRDSMLVVLNWIEELARRVPTPRTSR